MDDSHKLKHSQAFRLILLVLAIAAFVMVCTGIGKTEPLGFGSQRIEDATAALSNEKGTVIADDEGDRLLFINTSGQLVGMCGLDDKETPITTAAIPILLLAVPKGSVISKHGERANLHSAVKFLTSPIMLASLAFGIFPTVLANGYKSFILPLFLDSAGVSKSEISVLFAMGNAT